jgi:hypothetical protein
MYGITLTWMTWLIRHVFTKSVDELREIPEIKGLEPLRKPRTYRDIWHNCFFWKKQPEVHLQL